ncbi:hypothetical protein BHE74_00020588 [Ensete ventricosum]|nr:hypothetical protein BHE74_00020588 [Ensete ventricosum]
MTNSTSISDEASVSSETRAHDHFSLSSMLTSVSPHHHQPQPSPKAKKKRSQPGNPVVALSPTTLVATNRFVCEICNKCFKREQNLQLHRRGHNLPWKLRQRGSKEVSRKRVYVCPEPSCVHHHPSRALGDLTGIKKHFSRKHGEKKWKCDRKDTFITHRAFCDALAEESARPTTFPPLHQPPFHPSSSSSSSSWNPLIRPNPDLTLNPSFDSDLGALQVDSEENLSALHHVHLITTTSPHLSATALLQRTSIMGPGSFVDLASSLSYNGAMSSGVVSSGVDVQDMPLW